MTQTIDQAARKLASQAHEEARLAAQAIDDHKEHCATRWIETRDMIRGLYKRWWWLLTTIVGGMATIIFLLVRYQMMD
jgi:hypothetical protein